MDNPFLVCVIIGDKPSKHRIAEAASDIKKLLDEMSPNIKLAYTSGDGSTFGFFMSSGLKAGQIANRIKSPGGDDDISSKLGPLRNDVSLLVFEISGDSFVIGPSTLQNWLHVHRTSPNRASKSEAVAVESKAPSQLASQLAAIKLKISKS